MKRLADEYLAMVARLRGDVETIIELSADHDRNALNAKYKEMELRDEIRELHEELATRRESQDHALQIDDEPEVIKSNEEGSAAAQEGVLKTFSSLLEMVSRATMVNRAIADSRCEFWLRNKTTFEISVAIGRSLGGQLVWTEGWWIISAGSRIQPEAGFPFFANETIYYFAKGGDYTWQGDAGPFIIPQDAPFLREYTVGQEPGEYEDNVGMRTAVLSSRDFELPFTA